MVFRSDDLNEVRVLRRIVTEAMDKCGITSKKLVGSIVGFDPYRGITLAITHCEPLEEPEISIQHLKLDWLYIEQITVMPSKAKRYRKRDYYLD